MVMESEKLDCWRDLFGKNYDIFDIIENAIRIAVSDYPTEFRNRRERIAEMLFSSGYPHCSECTNKADLRVGPQPEDENEDGEFRRGGGSILGGGKESKVDRFSSNIIPQNYSYDEVEALTEEIAEETESIAEVLKIKCVLSNKNKESDSVLSDSLGRLKSMLLSVDTLKATGIGKTVLGLKKHKSNMIQQLAKTLVDEWKALVDEWFAGPRFLQEPTPESMTLLPDEQGLASPPLDEGIFMCIQPTSMELSKFFDGVDEYRELEQEKAVDPPRITQEIRKQKSQQEPAIGINKSKPMSKPARSLPPKRGHPNLSHCFIDAKSNLPTNSTALQDKAKRNNGDDNDGKEESHSMRAKVEITKRKFQQRYQEANDAKKRRTIQVVKPQDLPKPAARNKEHKRKLSGGDGHHYAANGSF